MEGGDGPETGRWYVPGCTPPTGRGGRLRRSQYTGAGLGRGSSGVKGVDLCCPNQGPLRPWVGEPLHDFSGLGVDRHVGAPSNVGETGC